MTILEQLKELRDAEVRLAVAKEKFYEDMVMGKGVTFEEFNPTEPTLATSCLCRKCGDAVLCRGIHDIMEPHQESMCANCAL